MRERGAVSLEAMLSIMLLLFMLLVFWTVARVIYDQSQVNTAAQYAAQAALLEYMRNAPTGGCDDLCRATAASRAEDKARDVANLNLSPDRALYGPRAGLSAGGFDSIAISCLRQTASPPWSSANCAATPASPIEAVQAKVGAWKEVDSPVFALRGLFIDESNESLTLRSSAFATSALGESP